MFKKRLEFFRSLLFLADLFVVGACWLAAYFIRFYAPIYPVTKGIPELSLYLTLLALVLVVFGVVLHVTGVYRRPWAGFSAYWWPIFQAATLGVVVSVTVTYFVKPYEFSRLVFLHFYGLLLIFLPMIRPLVRAAWRVLSPNNQGEPVLIVGDGELGRLIAGTLSDQPVLGLKVAGFLSGDENTIGDRLDGVPVLGGYDDVQKVIAKHHIRQVIMALPIHSGEKILEVVNQISGEMVDIKVVPDLLRYVSLRGSVEQFEGIPFIGLSGSPMEGWSRVAKRLTDLSGSLIGMIILSPLLAILAIAVKFSSPGPVLYRQERMGMDGKVFTMYKFRSMSVDAEDECGPVWACEGDSRRTRLGSFMRSTSLDELPQLFNVLKGEMSLVGPRPERPEFIKDFRQKIPGYMLRHKMKAGMTGWAQINGWRGNTSLERRIECDLHYIENWSLWLDLKIMLLTVVKGFRNAY